MQAIGFALPWPAISGADPCTGSYNALGRPFAIGAPKDADGNMPNDPVSIAAKSDSKSPNRLSVTITSNCLGQRVNCIAPASAYMWVSSTSEYSALWTSSTTRHFERITRHTGDFAFGVTLRVDANAFVALFENTAGFTEIDTGCQFAHDHHIQTCDHILFQG